MREISKREATFSLIAYIALMVLIGTAATIVTGSWGIWLLTGPLSGLLVVAIWGVWKW